MGKDDYYPVQNPPPLPVATLTDVKGTLRGLTEGIYLARDLYKRYSDLMATQSRQPVSPQAFGRMLHEFGALSRKRKGMSAWLIDTVPPDDEAP